jgi:hypothetical protein
MLGKQLANFIERKPNTSVLDSIAIPCFLLLSLRYRMLPTSNSTPNDALIPNWCHKITLLRAVAFGEILSAGARLILFSDDKPDRFFTVVKFWMDKTLGVALDLKTGVPTYPSRRRPAAPKACRRREEGRLIY